jgi:ribonucleotide monophosphatase NagD (HAD superfamily)
MIKNYIKSAFRSLAKNKGFTAINILGLALGLATCLLIVFYVADELSYDRYHTNAARIVRVAQHARWDGGNMSQATTSAPFANLELIAGKLDLFPSLESALASEHVTKHKPDPEVYLKTAENLSLHPSQCVVFEDSFSGVSAAKNAGMKVVGVLSSHTIQELPVCDLYIEDYVGLEVAKIQSLLGS